MLKQIKKTILLNLFSIGVMAIGWLVAIIDAGLDRFSSKSIFTKGTCIGFVIIIIGAYLLSVGNYIKNKNTNIAK